MKLYKTLFLFTCLLVLSAHIEPADTTEIPTISGQPGETNQIIPVPKQIKLEKGYLTLPDTLNIITVSADLDPLYKVLKEEFKSLYLTEVTRAKNRKGADLILKIDDSLPEETYRVIINEDIRVTGGSYLAVAMGTVSLLQSISDEDGKKSIRKGTIYDYPDLPFRGLLVDVARRKHHVAVLKQIISLCRWYKIRYIQLHLTDDNAFRFPSEAYPQLVTQEFYYTEEELDELIQFAQARGVEIIPELEVPGHAGEFIRMMPEIFAFRNQKLNRYTINMASDEIYPVLDTLIGEIANVFHSSRYIHIGGDEPDFSGMVSDPQMQQYIKSKGLDSVEELYWHFINRMHEFVKKQGKQTLVWEGFGKEGNPVVSKDIIVMAWETLYQLPSELLEAGFDIINVSWKPLYVVNVRKWDPLEIYDWNVYQWQNWLPTAPSYDTIQIDATDKVLGASMASWDQPEYTEISSLRKRIPAMAERVWNVDKKLSAAEFNTVSNQLNSKLSHYFSPVQVLVSGLSFPQVTDGRQDEQVWFDDTLQLQLKTPYPLVARFTMNGKPVTRSSPVYEDPLKFSQTTTLRYQAYKRQGEPVGHEILRFYELQPLKIQYESENLITAEERWQRPDSWQYPFFESLQIHISSQRSGVIRYAKGSSELNADSPVYLGPITIREDVFLKTGLFKGDSLIGQPWSQHFKKIEKN